ncbi:hypothetical protein PYCC9005_004478 [Savitreella phatthalungensis]
MDSDYCLICSKHTLGGVYCSQTCRMSDLEHEARRSSDVSLTERKSSVVEYQASAFPQAHNHHGSHVYAAASPASSTTTTPHSSPQFAPARSSTLPSLPLISALEKLTSLPATSISYALGTSTNSPASGENTSIWRNRRPLRYAF